MNNDILPPKRPLSQNRKKVDDIANVANKDAGVRMQKIVIDKPEKTLHLNKPRRKSKYIFLKLVGAFLVVGLLLSSAGFFWYKNALTAVDKNSTDKVEIQINEGETTNSIAKKLEEKGVIRSSIAFGIYMKVFNKDAKLQAGTYSLLRSESVEEIISHIAKGRVANLTITFLPGATLKENKEVLKKAGFSTTEIDNALNKTYEHKLFADKPVSADLEGYIYGETYSFKANASVEDILLRTFDEFYEQIEKNNLEQGFRAQNLNLYEGITLASIIQREVPGEADQKQVAQVFLKRLGIDMVLGSDVTAYYGADQIGVERSVAVDTPYNTRIHKGLTPGPIGAPGLSALLAVANPSEGDYLYFLSGDDDITYFAATEDGHEENIEKHCKIKCQMK